MVIYGDAISGNCVKVKWTADRLGLRYEWIDVDVLSGATRTPEFLALNPAGQAPVVVLDDGRPLAQSNAIIVHLAEGTNLIPGDPYARAKMFEWLFWEQYSHEPYIAVARFQMRYLGKPAEALDPKLLERGNVALRRLEAATGESAYLVGGFPTLADIALAPYTRWAGEGGFDLAAYPQVQAWIGRVERALGLG